MRTGHVYTGRAWVWAVGLWTICLVCGCGAPQRRTGVVNPVFFPSPPELPRLQFLTSYASAGDLGVSGPGGFERFVLGESEQREGIATPYGLAMFQGKIYVCDVGRRRVEVLDIRNRSFGYLTEDRRLVNPVNIDVTEDGTKYVADPTAGAVFVFDATDTLTAILGRQAEISPIDVAVRGSECYVTDFKSNQVVVLDKASGDELRRIGEAGDGDDQFTLISDLAFGPNGNLYVTDKIKAKIFEFDASGTLMRTVGRLGDRIEEFVRPKGIALDQDGRIWVVDAGVSMTGSIWSTEVGKIYDQEGRLLLFFGGPGNLPGMMNLPAAITLDYDDVDLFQQYVVPGAHVEFLVLVSNQYGPNKVSVYGFGDFSGVTTSAPAAVPAPSEESPTTPQTPTEETAVPQAETEPDQALQRQRAEALAQVYSRSADAYQAGRLEEARAGFTELLQSGAISASLEETLKRYLQDIDQRQAQLQADEAALRQRDERMANIYDRSVEWYRAGRLEDARAGFAAVLRSGLVPPSMEQTLRRYLQDIDKQLENAQGGGLR